MATSPVTDHSDALIQNANSIEKKDYINDLPLELKEKIFSFFSWPDLISLHLVQRAWKKISENGFFLSRYFPVFRSADFPSYTPVENIIKILGHYQDQEIEKLNLNCTNLTDAHLENLKGVKTKKFSMSNIFNSPISSTAFINFLKNKVLLSPATVRLQNSAEKWLNDDVIQEMILQKLSFKKLSFLAVEKISAEKFCEFVNNKGLSSPCKLNLTACQWVDDRVIEAFIHSQVQFSSLDLSACNLTKESMTKLIQSGCLLPNCEFIFDENDELSGNEIFSLLQSAKIKLKKLSLPHFDVPPDDLAKFILNGGLASPCQIELGKSVLTPAVLNALANAEVEIKSLTLHGPKENADLEKALQFLLTTGKWSASCELKLEGKWVTDNTINTLSESHLLIDTLSLEKVSVSSDAFLTLIRSNRLNAQKCNLELDRCDWVDLNFFTALTEKKIKLNSLHISKTIENIETGFIKLSEAGLLDELTSLGLANLNDQLISILRDNAPKLLGLSIRKGNVETLTKFFNSDTPRFKNLHYFIIKRALENIENNTKEAIKEQIGKKYPNLSYFIYFSDNRHE